MCGIFAFTGPSSPDPVLLGEAAGEAARRGPHGYGWAYPVPFSRPFVYRRLGALNGDLAKITALTATAVIGHARLATQGAMCTDPAGLQPVEADGHLLAHNGNVYNPQELAGPGYATDSAALAEQYAALRYGGLPPDDALAAAFGKAATPASAVAVLDSSGVLIAVRRRLPLWMYQDETGCYLSSRPFSSAVMLPEETIVTLG
jgi:glutamine phosphoribosylpyrophosphate amidotransferase